MKLSDALDQIAENISDEVGPDSKLLAPFDLLIATLQSPEFEHIDKQYTVQPIKP